MLFVIAFSADFGPFLGADPLILTPMALDGDAKSETVRFV